MSKFFRAFALVFVLVAAGCSESVSVSGTVTYQGKPLSYGTVVLVDSAGLPHSGQVDKSGNYSISGVKPGPVQIAVSSPRPPGMPNTGSKGKIGRDAEPPADDKKPIAEPPPADPAVIAGWTAIPDDYGDPAKSKLTADAKSGEPLNIELK